MKRKITLLLALVMCFSLTGCKKDKEEPNPMQQIQQEQQIKQEQSVQNAQQETPPVEQSPAPVETPAQQEPQTSTPSQPPKVEEPPKEQEINLKPDGETINYEPDISIMFDEEETLLDSLTFGENAQVLFEQNTQIFTNSMTEYMAGENQTIKYKEEDVFTKAYSKPSSKVGETMYFVQNPNYIGVSFTGSFNNKTTEEEIEEFTEDIRNLTGVFVSDIDLYDCLSDTIDNFRNYTKNAAGELSKTIWGSDNTIFVSLNIHSYVEKNEVKFDINVNLMLNNADLKYIDGARIDFALRDVKLTNDTAFVGTVIGYSPAGKDFTAINVCRNIMVDMTIGEDAINIKTKQGTPYTPETKETDAGLAYDFSNLKGKFDFNGFASSSEKTHIIATDIYGFSSCHIPINEGGFIIQVNTKNSEYFTNDMGKNLFIKEVEFFTGYKLTKENVDSLFMSVREGNTYRKFDIYQDGEKTGYVMSAQYNEDTSITLKFEVIL